MPPPVLIRRTALPAGLGLAATPQAVGKPVWSKSRFHRKAAPVMRRASP